MMTTTFVLDNPVRLPNQFDVQEAVYRVPTLPAYAIEHAELWTHPALESGEPSHFLLGNNFDIDGTRVIWRRYRPNIMGEPDPPLLVVHYHGIRDYELLFPAVECLVRRAHLARLYEEAQKGFEASAWLSFCLMCAGVFEGLLWSVVGKDGTLFELTDWAAESSVLTEREVSTIDCVRKLRNRIHIDRSMEQYVTRAEAMDIRKVLDDLVKRFSYTTQTAGERVY